MIGIQISTEKEWGQTKEERSELINVDKQVSQRCELSNFCWNGSIELIGIQVPVWLVVIIKGIRKSESETNNEVKDVKFPSSVGIVPVSWLTFNDLNNATKLIRLSFSKMKKGKEGKEKSTKIAMKSVFPIQLELIH